MGDRGAGGLSAVLLYKAAGAYGIFALPIVRQHEGTHRMADYDKRNLDAEHRRKRSMRFGGQLKIQFLFAGICCMINEIIDLKKSHKGGEGFTISMMFVW